MTEDQAKQKWCPFSRMAHWNAPTGGNRPTDPDGFIPHVNCIASDCMAWRWSLTNAEVKDGRLTPKEGYCGLAGKS